MVEVSGNGCHVVVKRGSGCVIYAGNGGLVEAAPGVAVTYRGCSGKIMERKKSSKQAKEVSFGKGVINVFNENGKHLELSNGICRPCISLPMMKVQIGGGKSSSL